ncbi:MAG: DUF2746 domain-containing protein [Fluviibacter sp.]
MDQWFNPDSWMDVVDHLLLIIGVVVTAAVPAWLSRRDIRDVKNQVSNGHKSPMRLDLDRVLERLEALSHFVSEIGRGVHGLRTDLVDEESRRRESVKELRGDIERSRGECRAGISHIERRLYELEKQINTNE